MSTAYASTLSQLAGDQQLTGMWWLAAARALDDLDERLALDASRDDGPTGAFADVVRREPWLSNAVERLSVRRSRLAERARRLRRVVTETAGDRSRAAVVQGELAGLADAVSRYLHRSRALYWDSYNRDLGGD